MTDAYSKGRARGLRSKDTVTDPSQSRSSDDRIIKPYDMGYYALTRFPVAPMGRTC
jgi:hypothetical protein